MTGEIRENQSAFGKLKKLGKMSLMRAIKVYPQSVLFDGMEPNETIVLFLRQHPIVLFLPVLRTILLFFVAIVLYYLVSIFAPQAFLVRFSSGLFVFITLALMLTIVNLFFIFLKWYFTVFIITNNRVVDIDFVSVFDATLSSTTLRDIQDASHSSPGFFSALFDMGNLQIQTAAEKERFEAVYIPKPRDVQDILMDLIENAKQNDNGSL